MKRPFFDSDFSDSPVSDTADNSADESWRKENMSFNTTPSLDNQVNPRRVLNKPSSCSSSAGSDNTQLLILEEVKKTNNSLSEFSTRLDAVESRLKAVEEYQISTASSSIDSSVEKTKRKVPARVRQEVRDIYKALLEQDEDFVGFNTKKRFTEKENQIVLKRLFDEMKSLDSEVPQLQVRDAARRFYQTKLEEISLKQKGKYDKKLVSQRRKNRLKRKLDVRRATILKSSNISSDVKETIMEVLTIEFMSSEESSNDDDGNHIMKVKPLPWRGKKASRLMRKLDKRSSMDKNKQSVVQTIPRVFGEPSSRDKPLTFADDFWGFVAE